MLEHEQREGEKQARLMAAKQELESYGLKGLEGRMQHGLDPAAMLAVKETRSVAEQIADKTGADLENLDELTKELHVGGVWKHAPDLGAAEKPEAVMWLALAQECVERNDAAELLNDDGFIEDLNRVVTGLKAFEADPELMKSVAEAKVAAAAEKFDKIDGVAYAEGEYPFLDMAVAGETAGVWKDGELYFVAADQLDFDSLAGDGLASEVKEDRGREATFWTKDGQDVVKQLYPGFGIVLNGDRDLALELARRSQVEPVEEVQA
jgi:hypothetical protein